MEEAAAYSGVLVDERLLEAGAARLNTATAGRGAPLLLLHGVTRCWLDYQPVIPSLAKRFRVLAPDHRGHGASSRGHAEYRVRDFAEDAAELLDRHLGGPVVIAGHSLGAMCAALVASRRPQQVAALVLEDPPGTMLAGGLASSPYALQFQGLANLVAGRAWDPAELARELSDLPVQHPADGRVVPWRELRDAAALRFAAECLVRLDARVLEAIVDGGWLEGLDWFGEIGNIRCPTLLLRADPACGGMLSEEEALRVESAIPECRRVDLPGHGHNIHATAPTTYLDQVGAFLEDVLDLTGRSAAPP